MLFTDDLPMEILLFIDNDLLINFNIEDHWRAQYSGEWAIVDITEDIVDLNTRAGETS